jgi:hypothetical protein
MTARTQPRMHHAQHNFPMFSHFPQWCPMDHHKSRLTHSRFHRLLAVLLTHSHLSQYSLKSLCLSPTCYAPILTPLTSSPCSIPTVPMGMTPNSLSSYQGLISPTSTPSSTSPSVKNTVYALPITHMGINLQIPITLPFYLGLFLLLYWSCICMTHGSTSLSFISILTHTGMRIAVSICLTFAFHLRLSYCYGFYLNLTILIPLL